MTTAGSFVSEACACGSNYYFSAQFNRFLWSAQITTSTGFLLISTSRTPPRIRLEIESVEDALAEWVYQTLCNHLEVIASSDETTAPGNDASIFSLQRTASNAPVFCCWSPAKQQESGSIKIHCRTIVDGNTLKTLKDRSITAIERFKDRAVQFDRYRTQMRSLLNQ